MPTYTYEQEMAALKLIERDFDDMSDDQKRDKHYTLLHTIDVLVDCGVLQYPQIVNRVKRPEIVEINTGDDNA